MHVLECQYNSHSTLFCVYPGSPTNKFNIVNELQYRPRGEEVVANDTVNCQTILLSWKYYYGWTKSWNMLISLGTFGGCKLYRLHPPDLLNLVVWLYV